MENMDLRMVVDGAFWYVNLFEAYPQWDVLSMFFSVEKNWSYPLWTRSYHHLKMVGVKSENRPTFEQL